MPEYRPGATAYLWFNTHQADGTPISLADSPAVALYKNNAPSPITTGVTLTTDFAGIVGLNLVTVVMSNALYAIGSDFTAYMTAGTVDTVSVVGAIVGYFCVLNSGTFYKLQRYFSLSDRGDAGVGTDLATELAEINTNYGSGAGVFDNTDNPTADITTIEGGDATTVIDDRINAGLTAFGVSTLNAAGVRVAIGMAAANLDTQLSALGTLDAAGVRNAIGLAAANLDTQLGGLAAPGDAMTLTSAYNLPFAHLRLDLDGTANQDEYTASFSLNGVYQSTVASATIRVVKRSDGTNLVATTAMTEIGSSGSYKYDASGGERMTVGDAVLVFTTFTVGVTTYVCTPIPFGRDRS